MISEGAEHNLVYSIHLV